MNFISLDFFLFILLAILLLRFATQPHLKSAIVFLLNAVFFASFFTSPIETLPVLGMLVLGYACLQIISRFRAPALVGILIFSIVFVFAWLKRYALIAPLLPMHATPLVVVGLSYILFRILHLLIDVAQGDKTVPPLLHYFNYCLFFPTFVSGPIQRYEDFELQISQPPQPLTVPVLHRALCRILLGIILVVICSAYASTMVDFFKNAGPLATPMRAVVFFSLTSFAVLLKLYTNFSGSMHIVMGIGTLAGFTLPENFNKPYLAKNFLDFWARWHITLSEWIKFYLFNPLLKWLTGYFPSLRAANYVGALAFFISFLVIGLWHGTTLLFLVFGLMLGLGATVNKFWQQFCIYYFGKTRYKSLTQRNWYFQFSRALTLSYIAIALMCLWLEPAAIYKASILWESLIASISLVVMMVALALLGGVADWIFKLPYRNIIRLQFFSSEHGMVLSMVCMIWVVCNIVALTSSKVPEFIYKSF